MNLATLAVLLATTITVPTRSGSLSIAVPDGWRLLKTEELKGLRPTVQPQNRLQQRLAEKPSGTEPVLAMKHDAEGTIAASLQAFCNPIPDKMRYASSIELARVIAAVSVATFQGKYEAEPREITVDGLPAAEWIVRYVLVETKGGSHLMKSRSVIVALANTFYVIGYSGPDDDVIDFETFDTVLRSVKIGKLKARH